LRLSELEANHEKVLQVFSEVSEIILQCHGTTAGSAQGYGICVSNHKQLPPAILSVEEQADHADFIITWEDIQVSPRIFVSIACSSGITEIGKAGVRIGLEQTLFSSGTQIIISPLWDVEQGASLMWLEVFYRNRYNNPQMGFANMYQKTCLEVKQLYPHYYQWGAFILNGSINTV